MMSRIQDVEWQAGHQKQRKTVPSGAVTKQGGLERPLDIGWVIRRIEDANADHGEGE